MRAKHVLSHFNLRSRAKLVWSRITLSRLTTVYFAVATIHCAIQIILQSQAFSVNASAANSLWTLIIKAGQSKEGEGFAILSDDLRLCYHLPRGSTAECSVIWTPNGTIAADRDPEYAVQISSADVDPLVTSTVQISSTQQLSSSASVQTGTSNRAVNTAQATRVVSTSVVSSSSTARQIGTVSDVNNAQSALTSTATVTVVLSTAPPAATTRTITTSSSQRATPSSSSSTQQVKSTASSIIAFSQPPQSTAASVGVNAGTAGDDDDNESVASDDSDDDDESDDDESDDKGVDGLRAFINKVTGSVGLAGARTQTSKRELSVVPGLNGTFTITDNSQTFDVSQTCIQALIYPVQKLSNTKREDITLIGFQFWVLTMSFVAILNESIPHLSAALVTQLLIAVWTAIQVTETESFRKEFFRLIVNGACHSPNLLGYYWQARIHAEIASAVLNGVAVLVTGIMTYKLFKVYSWQTYKRIGASLAINRIYKLVLCLSVAIQLALFFVVATAGLWIDQLYHGSVAHMSVHRTIYQSGVIVMACFLPPWLALGWFAMRREWRLWSLVFLTLNLAFLTMWGVQFNSNSFRWTLILWRFFSLMAVISGLLLLATLGLGLACRLNFGKGLPSYLNFQESVDGVDFAPVYPDLKDPEMGDYKEKIDFPSSGGSRSSDNFADQQTYGSYGNGYNAGYGSYTSQGTAPSYGSQGTDSRTEGVRSPERVAYPTHIRTRSGSTLTSLTPAALTRTDTQSSHVSQNSVSSLGSNTSNGRNAIGKRWVIE